MEAIKIYHSSWRMLLLALGSLALVAGSYFMLEQTKDVFHVVVAWMAIMFFVLCGLYILYSMVKERLTGKPFLTITDDDIIIEGATQTVVHFSDVESFEVVKMNKQTFVAIHYKPGVEKQKLDESSTFSRSVRKLNLQLANAQENISTVGTNIKAETLCDLLNERLAYSTKGEQLLSHRR